MRATGFGFCWMGYSGKAAFQNEIVWKRVSNHNDAGRFGRTADRLLFYGAPIDRNRVRVPLAEKNVASKYRHKDARGLYRRSDLTGPGISEGESVASWSGWNPADIGRHWSVPKTGDYAAWLDAEIIPGYLAEDSILARLNMLDRAELIAFTSNGTPELKRYLAAGSGQVPPDIWLDIPPVNSQASERTTFPTQKPLALLDRIIQASSNEGDVVFDPFAGCATACVAAEKRGRQWVGIDISEKAAELVQVRIRKEIDLFHNFKAIHRTDQPQRTDLGKLPSPATHKDLLYGKQSGQCGGCMVMFHKRNMTIDHIVPRKAGGTDHVENPVASLRSLQLIEGNEVSGRVSAGACQERGINRMAEMNYPDSDLDP